MKTIIQDETELPEEVQEVARKEALKRNCTMAEELAGWLLEKARAVNASVKSRTKLHTEVAA